MSDRELTNHDRIADGWGYRSGLVHELATASAMDRQDFHGLEGHHTCMDKNMRRELEHARRAHDLHFDAVPFARGCTTLISTREQSLESLNLLHASEEAR